MKDEAVFVGYQEAPGLNPLPLFNVRKKGHPRFESTVSALTLEREGLKIPKFPTFLEWKENKS